MAKKLTKEEKKRLLEYISKNGGRHNVAHDFGVRAQTLDRSIVGHTGPAGQLRNKFVEIGVIKKL